MNTSPLRLAVVGLLGLSVTLSVSCPACAQIDNGLPGPQPLDAGALILSDNMLRLNLERATSQGSQTRSSAGQVTRRTERTSRIPKRNTVRASTPTTTYRANPSITRKVKSQYLAQVRQRSPQAASELQRVFARHDPISLWQGLVSGYGLHTGDSADALTAYWVLNYLVANQGQQPTQGQALAVRAQVRSALTGNPAFGRLSSAQRQTASELWMMNFVVQQGTYSAAVRRSDKVMLQKLARAAKARFQAEMHIDLTQLALTNRGFVPRM